MRLLGMAGLYGARHAREANTARERAQPSQLPTLKRK